LIEAPSGTVLASHTVQAPMGDLFQLQDDVARRVIETLVAPLAGGSLASSAAPSPAPEAAPRAGAYELYLRANDLARTYAGLPKARKLYEQCLDLDPEYAPAWAHLGRCHRVIGKFSTNEPDSEARAEDAFRHALRINPRLTIAHKFCANLEADIGRATDAVARLLGEAARQGNDPELFAGLVHACRYCGLYDESIAAHDEAQRLDPNVVTSVRQTLLIAGHLERLLDLEPSATEPGDHGIRVAALALSGRTEEARALLARRPSSGIAIMELWVEHLGAWLDRDVPRIHEGLDRFAAYKIFEDPEALFQEGWLLCDVGSYERGLKYLGRAVDRGYLPAQPLAVRPQFDAVRDDPTFQSILADAEAGREQALAVFREAGGGRLLRT
jgi:tetratricopeptide (TPR) repeat protein